ncbi:hypothetical protein CFHF_18955 [Caulobacter flavus]|uniref:DUF4238 domain-containing protein n=1 Tax=Caulobacter flavus TaxID=1679497 RepID=A0A2N5CPZ3_9CAUL|nr:DUF4238 domain-containing protein [Caulobacter flavus]PLR09217.1 hypothetical protein CFHF_18955 [Caulobacter flavus]
MTQSRNNHYVPRWYQEGFFEPGGNTLAYLDLTPPTHKLPDGRVVSGRSRFKSSTPQCFVQRDLYSTFFGVQVNDEIERKLFGAVDTDGAPAVKAFMGSDPIEWHRHFQTLFTYVDIQKMRTPKGLAWLRAQYPELSQNELMFEMQGVQMLNCTIWTEGVREIVSAEDSDVKFIVTDSPVTVYNPAIAPTGRGDHDPSIRLKGSQTIFPLNRDFCLILTNLEYAKDPSENPLERRTFARNFRASMVRTDTFIRTRKLAAADVLSINAILKACAHRYVAAGREEWLHPEQQAPNEWQELGAPLRPPQEGLWNFGGEIFAKLNDGRVLYQDEFGRTEKPYEALQKTLGAPGDNDFCGCGSGRAQKYCCRPIPVHLRPSWTELSIRERNLALCRAAKDIIGFGPDVSWAEVRKAMTDERISRLYGVFTAFWPLETDLLQLLPKPDGRPRAVYSGVIHPELINEFAVGASLYFGELLIIHPFVHAGAVNKEYSPVDNPRIYRQEILKALSLLFTLEPLIYLGLVNLVPNPGAFDHHLQMQTMQMAEQRSAGRLPDLNPQDRAFKVMDAERRRSQMLAPPDALKARLLKSGFDVAGISAEEVSQAIEQLKLADPLVSLQPDSLGGGQGGGVLNMFQLQPNFEMALYLAQATGSVVVTDSAHRWAEILDALLRRGVDPHGGLGDLVCRLEKASFAFPQDEMDVFRLALDGSLAAYPPLLHEAGKYLTGLKTRASKPNYEAGLAGRFSALHVSAQSFISKRDAPKVIGRMKVAAPVQGIYDPTVNRLLLMSNAEHYLDRTPMAFFLEPR